MCGSGGVGRRFRSPFPVVLAVLAGLIPSPVTAAPDDPVPERVVRVSDEPVVREFRVGDLADASGRGKRFTGSGTVEVDAARILDVAAKLRVDARRGRTSWKLRSPRGTLPRVAARFRTEGDPERVTRLDFRLKESGRPVERLRLRTEEELARIVLDPPPEEPGDAPLIRGPEPTFQTATAAGPYAVATYVQADGMRDGPGYLDATVHYPVDADPPFASVVIVPGFSADQDSIRAWGPFYASHGIVAMTIDTNSPFEFPPERSAALLDAVVSLRAENSRIGSPLEGHMVLDRVAVSGWSMGGGGGELAAVADPTLRAVVAMCPWQPLATYDHPVPVLVFGGSKDLVAPLALHGFVHYEGTPATTPKLLFEVEDGVHDVANSPTGGNGDVGRFGLAWLKVFLEGDERYRKFLLVEPESASRYETNL